MKLEPILGGFREELFISPSPSTRRGTPSVILDMSEYSDDDVAWSCYDERNDVASNEEANEGRLSRSLQTWMIDHKWKTIQPLEKPPKEPVFSGKLDRKKKTTFPQELSKTQTKKSAVARAKTAPVRRVPSEESLLDKLSLLSCSSVEAVKPEEERKTKKRRRRKIATRVENVVEDAHKSIWVEFATKKTKLLTSLFRGRNCLTTDVAIANLEDSGEFSGESEAFRMLARDEQLSLFHCGMTKGLKYVNKKTLTRSSSLSDLKDDFVSIHPVKVVRRTLSASAKKPYGKVMDINDLRKERLKRIKILEHEKQMMEKERHRRNSRKLALQRRSSSKSVLESIRSRPGSPSNTFLGDTFKSPMSPELRGMSPSEHSVFTDQNSEERVTVWKADRQILEIDLKKELTQRVKQRISTTRLALKRVTGVGDRNEQQQTIGRHDEFPNHVKDDYCNKPKITQKMRISPSLSGVIHDDIQVRMGRPRYHEIRETDLEQWNRGQPLNRAHRNLKVFNWLHSLKERDFREEITPEIMDDIDLNLADELDLLHVEAADEPHIKPLYKAYEVRIL